LAEIYEKLNNEQAALDAWGICEDKADLSNPAEAQWYDTAVQKSDGSDQGMPTPKPSK
jgi:hypothetical protein